MILTHFLELPSYLEDKQLLETLPIILVTLRLLLTSNFYLSYRFQVIVLVNDADIQQINK
jgi:hypothetical protein